MQTSGDFSVYIQWEADKEALLKEWEGWKEKTAHLHLLTLYFGGSPPLHILKEILTFIGGSPQEITLEIQEATLDEAKSWRALGVNRIQAPPQEALIKRLVEAGFNNISIELSDLSTAPLHLVTHISLTDALVSKETIALLESAGFERYELFNFCKEGKRSLHTSGYSSGRPFIGLGPKSHSYFDGVRSCQDFSEKLTGSAKVLELFILALRFKEGVNLASFELNVGPLLNETKEQLKKLEERGWIENSLSCPRLTLDGLLFYDEIAVELI